MIYIVDIDGTICNSTVYEETGKIDYNLMEPLPERIEKINKLYEEGHEIHYWTARGALSGIDWYDVTAEQLEKWGAKYTSLRVGDKPHYDMWIDDKARWSEDFFKK